MKTKFRLSILSFGILLFLAFLLPNTILSQTDYPVPILREGAEISPPAEDLDEKIRPWGQQEFSPKTDSETTTQIINFENGVDGAVIQSGIPGVTFSTTDRQDWLYGDIRTGKYNVYPYGSGAYRCNGNFFAWLGPNQGRGRIDFTQGVASAVTLKYSSYSIVHLEAYGADGGLLDSASGSGNLNQPMGTLSVSAPSIAYLIFHDSGNYWLIDDVEITLEDVEIINIYIPDSNIADHHTIDYTDLVLRRGQVVNVVVEASLGYDENYHTIGFRAQFPDGSEENIPQTGGQTDWYAKQTGINRTGDKTEITFDLHVSGNATVGKYSLEGDLSQSNGGAILDSKECPDEFYIIFNPWSTEDTDVYKASMVSQLDHYILGGTDWNYYYKTTATNGAWDDTYDDAGNKIYRGAARKWTMGVTDSTVFAKAMEDLSKQKDSAKDVLEKLRKKVQKGIINVPDSWGQPDTDIIWANWLPDAWANWGNVPATLASSTHPHGQCMDFSATLTSLARSIGIPARMVTCVRSGGWNFHAWTEVLLNQVDSTHWSAVDGTPIGPYYYHGFGPTDRNGALFQHEVTNPGATAVYTYDVSSTSRIDIKGLYGVTSSTSTRANTFFNPKTFSDGDINISIVAEDAPYLIGDEARIIVTVNNTGDTELSTSLNLSVVQEFYNNTTRDLAGFPARNITVPAGGSISETYKITRNTYQYQGTYLVAASADTATSEMRFNIEDGLDVAIDMLPVDSEPELYDITVNITNILARDISDLEVEVYFPTSAEVLSNPLIFSPTIVTAGELVSKNWRVRFTERGQAGVVSFAHSEEAGHDKSNAHENVRGDTKALCWFEEIPIINLFETVEVTTWVENIGGVATDVNVELYIPESLSINTQTLHTLYDLAPGEKRGITFDLTSSEAGRFALTMTTLDQKGNVCLDIGPVTVSDRSREISAQVEPNQVSGNETSHAVLSIQNLTSLSDDVVISSYASKPGVKYAIFDNNTRVLGQPVHIPANTVKTLDIEILPSSSAELYIICKSIHDPLAQASAKINILGTVVNITFPPPLPFPGVALQDGVTLTAEASSISGVAQVYFYLREPDGTEIEVLAATFNATSGNWEYDFNTTLLPDGNYALLAKAIDENGNEGWSELVPFSIRNWAVIQLLPASQTYRAGRTMPVKFSLRIAAAVDPAQPFVYNEELEIRIYKLLNPDKILQQTSLYGDTSTDYRMNTDTERYITNFKTSKQPAEYLVEIWRLSKNFLIDSFTFETTKK